MRGHFLNYRAVGRLLLFAGVAIAVVVAADWLIRHCQSAPTAHGLGADSRADDGLEVQLARCQAKGTAAQADQACIAAWSENRRRFFGSAP